MIKCISLDGVDGAGKTTIVSALSNYYNVVQVPKFYCMEMVPYDVNERINWFRTMNAEDTTKIYISGHKMRYMLAGEFKKGLHYKFLEKNNKPPLVVIDRGELSLKAFSFAALKRGTNWNSQKIDEFLCNEFGDRFEQVVEDTIDHSFLLFAENSLEHIYRRRAFEPEDKILMLYQQEYYEKHQCEFMNENITIISPLLTREEVLNLILEKLNQLGV